MSTLLSAALGRDKSRPQSPRLPRPFLVLLTVTMAAIYLSNTWSAALTTVLLQAKWLPLGVLGVTASYMFYARGGPSFPLMMTVPMLGMLIIAALSAWTSINVGYSLLSVVTVGGTIACSYAVSALIIATDSRRAYFELIATFCRVMIVATILFTLAGLNFGRGAGLTAWSDNPNTLALVLTPGMVVFLAGCIERRPGWQVWHAAFFVIGFYLIWATNSRAAVIWIGLSLMAFWIYRRGPGLTVVLAMAGLIILIGWWYPIKLYLIDVLGLDWSVRNMGISPLSGREEVWRVGWQLFEERPVFGYGLGSSQDLIRMESWRFLRHQGLHFHSSYIMVMVELGILGLIALLSAIGITLARAIAYSGQTRVLPRESWPLAALPFALVVGALGHALFESWLIAAGNANMMLFWTWVWMIHHQSQVKIRAVIHREKPQGPIRAGAALPAR